MGNLLVYFKGYQKECVLAPLFKMLEASIELMIPLVMAAIIDRGITGGDSGYIVRMGVVLIAFALVGLVTSITAQYFAAKAAVGVSAKIRHALFKHIQTRSFSDMDAVGTSTMINRMTSDINQVQTGINLVLRLFLRSPFIVAGAVIMAFTIDVRSAIVFAITVPVLSVVVFGLMLWCIAKYKKVQAGLDQVLGTTRENLKGARVLRAFNKEEAESARFSGKNAILTSLQLNVGRISGLMNPLTCIIINLAVLVLIRTGALQVRSGLITQGAVVALVNYMAQILVELVKLANLILSITKARACAGRIQEIFDLGGDDAGLQHFNFKTDIIVNANNVAPAVEFRHVSLTYRNAGNEALTDISFTAEKGQVTGIIGGTGSGKSSLVNLIPAFYPTTGGQVLVNGTDVSLLDPAMLRSRIGLVPQKATLFRGTVRENLSIGKKDATEEEMYRALEIAQAREIIEKKKEGLDYRIRQGGKNLSGGQQQRLTIARAVIREPEILILDDSSSALDFVTDAKLRKSIRDLKNTTVFIVSQRPSALQHADQILVLEEGSVVGIGTHAQLLESCSVYQEIYYSQFPKEG